MNIVNLSANGYIYRENEQKFYVTANFEGELCEIKIFMWNTGGTGWHQSCGIEITVDGVDYGTVKLPHAFDTYEGEETVLIPSGEVIFSWAGNFQHYIYGFEIYNTLGELIYTSPDYIPEGLFFTDQNECVECLSITDLEGVYIPEEHQVNLSWEAPESTDLIGFDIYRNDELIAHVSPSTVFYSDNTEELESGDYKYCVVPVYPAVCTLDEACFETPMGIANYKAYITVYPNPANGMVNISGVDIASVKVFNSMGQLILNQRNTNAINVSALTNGIYIFSIELSTGYMIQKKIIINR